jgi:hypothetical protein
MVRAKARNASLASPEVGNAAATSGSSTTTALPAAYRDAYLLRVARLKSYSGRISSASTRFVPLSLVGDFFTVPSLAGRRPSRPNDTNCSVLVNVHHRKQTMVLSKAQEHEPFFRKRRARVGNNATQRIAEHTRCLLERDLVFGQICCGFSRVPLELQRQSSLYLDL